mmetsp:Transcript_33826/g.95941  ORF Transcript_33826/g.95941 Transcript_33826/m.95941 type:complete len:248 (+) Transcript_33826:96-839(+)
MPKASCPNKYSKSFAAVSNNFFVSFNRCSCASASRPVHCTMLAPGCSSCQAARLFNSVKAHANNTFALALICIEKGKALSNSLRHDNASLVDSSVGGLTANNVCILASACAIHSSTFESSSVQRRHSHLKPEPRNNLCDLSSLGKHNMASVSSETVISSPRGTPSVAIMCNMRRPLGKPFLNEKAAAFGLQLCLIWLQSAYTARVPSGLRTPNLPKMAATRTKCVQNINFPNSGRSLTKRSAPSRFC